MDKYQKPQGSLFSFFSNKVKQYGGINFAQGIPGFQPPSQLMESLKNLTHSNIHQYAPGIGNHKLLALLENNYSKVGNVGLDNFLILQGATEAISLVYTYLLNLENSPMQVVAFDPVYESYNNLPAIFKNDFTALKLGPDNKIDTDTLEQTLKKFDRGIIFLNSPGNPYGRIISKDEVIAVHNLAHKYNYYIIFDAVYKDLYFKNPPYIPLDILDDRIFYVNSFSKMLSITGWRIGYLICSPSHMKKIRSIHDYIGLCAPSILQEAIASYLSENNYGMEYVIDIREKLLKSFDQLSESLKNYGFKIPPVDGGYFIWSELPENMDDGFKFSIDLYDEVKVATIPGIHFSSYGKRFVRFNVAREESELNEGIEKIDLFFKNIK